MVRRIRSCASCCCRFVSEANSSLCCACKEKGEASSSFEPNLKRAKVTSSDCDDNSISPNTPVIDLCDENFPNDEDAVSEGGDDIHCTQILEVDEKTDEIIAKDQNQTPQVTKSPPESKISSSTNDNNDDICFICGVLLSGLKRRVDHIKRCSKKHLITGRDVVHNDHDAFATDSTTNQTSTSNLKNNNPYSRDSSSWHGDATLALRLADQHEPSKNTSTMEPQKKQTSLTSFLQAPIRNVNNVLLAGARRVSKVAEVVASRKSKDPEKAAAPYGRFGKRRRDYSKVRLFRLDYSK